MGLNLTQGPHWQGDQAVIGSRQEVIRRLYVYRKEVVARVPQANIWEKDTEFEKLY